MNATQNRQIMTFVCVALKFASGFELARKRLANICSLWGTTGSDKIAAALDKIQISLGKLEAKC